MTKTTFPRLTKGYKTTSDLYIKNVDTYLRKRVTVRMSYTNVSICVEQQSDDALYSCTFINITKDDVRKMNNKIK